MHGGSCFVQTIASSVIAVAIAACASPGGAEPSSGTLVINLISSAPDGNQYVLRNATLTVTGPDSVQVFRTEDQLLRESLSANVPAGHYSALLDPGWRLERFDAFSSAEVNAELASDNPLQFTVEFGERTVVPLRFRTNIGDLRSKRRAAHAREAMGQHAAPQGFGELALNMTGQSATFGVGCAHLGEHRLPVPRDEFVQHRALGFAASVAGERLSGRAGRSFVQAAREHLPAS